MGVLLTLLHEAISFDSSGSDASSSSAFFAAGALDLRSPLNSNNRLLPCDRSFARTMSSSIESSVTVSANAAARPLLAPNLSSTIWPILRLILS